MLKRDLWLPSASSAVRSLHCPGSVVLPRVKSETTPAMHRGSYLHLRLEELLTQPPVLDLLTVRDEARTKRFAPRFAALANAIGVEGLAELCDTCEKIHRDDILRGSEFISAEEAFAYSPAQDSARSLGCSIEREYRQHGWIPTEEIAGTADVILRTPTGLLVGDFKTGHFDDQVSYSWAPQLDMLGLMAARRYGVSEISVGICLVMDDGRIHWTQERRLDALDLDAIAATVSAAVRGWHEAALILSHGGTPPTKQGPWCDYCASKTQCPAWLTLAREFASGALSLPAVETSALTPQSAGAAYEKLQRLTSLTEELTKQLREYAHAQPLVLPDGTRLGHIERSREEIDGAKAAAFIRQSYSQAKLDEVAKVKITKAALEETFGRDEAKTLLAALRKQNAIKRVAYTVLGEIKGKP